MLEIEIAVGGKTVLLKGSEKAYELCEQRNVKDKDSGVITKEWTPYAWFPSLSQAMTRLLEMKIRASEARSLTELIQLVKHAKDELQGLYDTNIA